jgi:hypothetical protein
VTICTDGNAVIAFRQCKAMPARLVQSILIGWKVVSSHLIRICMATSAQVRNLFSILEASKITAVRLFFLYRFRSTTVATNTSDEFL